ncbi:hypothetical protein H310_07708 [Aphanomyces invadans]|uniref:Uncharacterized protein n=1 Tax=Aphanomyces invadans TaxID=157072 RepID=A0A024U1P4_9STRA|nr:hypothetical protein H310_07708 [Aphanomyces invadans]ETW00341.1 hypothetical protein H310_07708 [Aphanomyces invadans]|eukprot:XP_008871366.1 hypothetical protein H310_07708 [Aphanomyces invadans]
MKAVSRWRQSLLVYRCASLQILPHVALASATTLADPSPAPVPSNQVHSIALFFSGLAKTCTLFLKTGRYLRRGVVVPRRFLRRGQSISAHLAQPPSKYQKLELCQARPAMNLLVQIARPEDSAVGDEDIAQLSLARPQSLFDAEFQHLYDHAADYLDVPLA